MTKSIHEVDVPLPLFDTLEHHHPRQVVLPQHSLLPKNAESDLKLASEFLYSYRGSEATFNSYRREIERLLHWCWYIAKKSLTDIQRKDIETFVEFCQRPPAAWIGTKNIARFIENEYGDRIPNTEWRPFVSTISKTAFKQGESPDPKKYALSQKALQAIFAIVGSFYNFLIAENYVGFNPVLQIRQKSKYLRKQQQTTVIRRLSELQWNYVIETAEILAKNNPEQHERTLFILSALYGMYLRISELATSTRWQPMMGHFYVDNDNNWWFVTVGKGNKERHISVSDAMLNALKRYRISRGLSALPYLGETTPLITQLNEKTPISSTRHIRQIVQFCFDQSIERMKNDGFHQEAEQLKAATVHWLRHTGISEDVKIRPREHVRDDAGHSSSAITDKYIDVERRERHRSARKKVIHEQ